MGLGFLICNLGMRTVPTLWGHCGQTLVQHCLAHKQRLSPDVHLDVTALPPLEVGRDRRLNPILQLRKLRLIKSITLPRVHGRAGPGRSQISSPLGSLLSPVVGSASFLESLFGLTLPFWRLTHLASFPLSATHCCVLLRTWLNLSVPGPAT